MIEWREGTCYPKALMGVNVGLASVDAVIAVLAFAQLMRIHSRNTHSGWTRQKVFHLMIGSSNLAFPKILFLAAFLLLLSFWVDLCHQSNDEEDEDDVYSPREALLEKNKPNSNADSRRRCCSLRAVKVGSRQKVVVLVTLLVFLLMLVAAVLIWIGRGRNPIDSSVVARVYVDLFALAVLLLGVALACYGLVLFLKMSKVRSERASSEMWKVAGLAVVSVLCFTSSAAVAIFTDIPLLFNWHGQKINGVCTSLLMVLYYFIGSSVPSAFVLWVMRELPPPLVTFSQQESRTIAFINDSSATVQPQRWTAAASVQNQVSRASPI
ncbi:tobamovirus multiplication protein 1 isoform X2 [Solanum pennellii]|uniref:Tobamovirus multiplication protein 1 isoform X2 n=1 Tax=Solanum pennellii TaxID=28526 RepID=A0ABM1V4E1_SOLPN|nr:tobamovirus multiplication protein 1 isoform X2 [Solanum pennellii]